MGDRVQKYNCSVDVHLGLIVLQMSKFGWRTVKKQLKEEKKHFFDILPVTIKNEKTKLDNLKAIRNDVEKK